MLTYADNPQAQRLKSMEGSSFANCLTVMKIRGNGLQIFCLNSGPEFLLGALTILFLQKWGVSCKLAVLGTLFIIVGLAGRPIVTGLTAKIAGASPATNYVEPLGW